MQIKTHIPKIKIFKTQILIKYLTRINITIFFILCVLAKDELKYIQCAILNTNIARMSK
jgi:hypothetical protein